MMDGTLTIMQASESIPAKPLLLIGHPGHELRILEWVRQTKPDVVILTHGEGSIGQPRLEDSRRQLEQWGVRVRTDWLTPVSDATVYQSLLGGNSLLFANWLDGLARSARLARIDMVVADEADGYNPTHDLCRVLANRLVSRLQDDGRSIRNLGFPLVGHSCDPERESDVNVSVKLTDDQWKFKLSLILDYARRTSPALLEEVQTMIANFGADSFSRECLYSVGRTSYEDGLLPDNMPYFERVGEERLKAGIYKVVVRAEHLLRLVSVTE